MGAAVSVLSDDASTGGFRPRFLALSLLCADVYRFGGFREMSPPLCPASFASCVVNWCASPLAWRAVAPFVAIVLRSSGDKRANPRGGISYPSTGDRLTRLVPQFPQN